MATQSNIQLDAVNLKFVLFKNRTLGLREILLHSILFKGLTRTESFMGLNNISLKIAHGERIALIGRNGAGKSSLLKAIANVYPITSGRLTVQGRISAMIETGAGFHPELTGRENIYLNGVIYGFSREEVKSRLDSILEFADVDVKFLDTPIKYFSTGMQMRVAFAVAAELDPEILIMDEIFLGGDIGFVKKAQTRLMELIERAHIMILVTHDMDLALKVASRAIWIEEGRILQDGDPAEVISAFKEKVLSNS